MLIWAGLSAVIAATTGATAGTSHKTETGSVDTGYSALKLFLEDEQHLTTIRRVKLVLAFEGISDRSARLVDQIADASDRALDQLEKLSEAKPRIAFEDFSDESIGKATLDSMRMATVKEILLQTDDFEKDLLLSQSQILPVISHLARQLEQQETNSTRKAWLNKLAVRYEEFYRQVHARISITKKS